MNIFFLFSLTIGKPLADYAYRWCILRINGCPMQWWQNLCPQWPYRFCMLMFLSEHFQSNQLMTYPPLSVYGEKPFFFGSRWSWIGAVLFEEYIVSEIISISMFRNCKSSVTCKIGWQNKTTVTLYQPKCVFCVLCI